MRSIARKTSSAMVWSKQIRNKNDLDIDVMYFADMLCYLEPHPAITERLDKWGSPYTSEKAHMCLWFMGQTTTGSGSYARNKPNDSVKATYNRLLCPGAMLWIAEVLGEAPERLEEAYEAATVAENVHWRNRGKGFREVIPFERIYELFLHPEGWLYEKRLLSLVGRDEQGYPVTTDEDRFSELVLEELN